MRETYWTFARIWPDRAEVIMKGLDVSGRKALEKANPAGMEEAGRSSVMGTKSVDLGASTASAQRFHCEGRTSNEWTCLNQEIRSGTKKENRNYDRTKWTTFRTCARIRTTSTTSSRIKTLRNRSSNATSCKS